MVGVGLRSGGEAAPATPRAKTARPIIDPPSPALSFTRPNSPLTSQYETGKTGNKFIGGTDKARGFFASGFVSVASEGWEENPTGKDFAAWFFQYVFAAAAATIVSGAVAERCEVRAPPPSRARAPPRAR